jgi:cytosine/creatinine deaminase
MQLTVHQAQLDTTGEIVNLGIENGKFVTIQKEDLPRGEQFIDANGAMISPPLIESHFHLENSLIWNNDNDSGTLWEAVALYTQAKEVITKEDIISRGIATLREALSHGTLWLRSHVDIEPDRKLLLLEGVLEVKKRFSGLVDVQTVAFPQHGLAKSPETVDLMWKALEMGADMVGGCPHAEKDMDDAALQIEIAFEMAIKHDLNIDMHIDETDDPYWHSLELLAEKTIEAGYQDRVTASHCVAMSAWSDELAERVISKVKEARINIVTNTPVNLLLQGRGDAHPKRRGITRVKELVEAGVNLSCGQDDLMNMFYPFGRMDPLEVATYVAHIAHMSSPAEILKVFDMPRYRAAQTFGVQEYGIEVGNPANFILLQAQTPLEALRKQPAREVVVREGQILVQTKTSTSFSDQIPVEG